MCDRLLQNWDKVARALNKPMLSNTFTTERKDIFITMAHKTGWVELSFKMCCHDEVENQKSESNGTYFMHYHGLCFLV